MKKLLKLLLILPLFISFPATGKSKKDRGINMSSISKEAIEQMKLEQYIINLSGNEYTYFENSVYAFSEMGEKAVNPLLEHLKKNKDDKKIVNAVLYTLGRLKKNGTRAIPVIMEYLKDPDYDTKVTAVSALGGIGKSAEKSVPALRKLMLKEGDWLTQVTIRSLGQINTPIAKNAIEDFRKYQLLKKQRELMANTESINQQTQ